MIRGRVYLTTSTEVLALDGRSGEVVWRTQLPSSGTGALATDGRDLLLLSPSYDGAERRRDDRLRPRHRRRACGRSRTRRASTDVQLLNGLLVGWSHTSEEITLLE